MIVPSAGAKIALLSPKEGIKKSTKDESGLSSPKSITSTPLRINHCLVLSASKNGVGESFCNLSAFSIMTFLIMIKPIYRLVVVLFNPTFEYTLAIILQQEIYSYGCMCVGIFSSYTKWVDDNIHPGAKKKHSVTLTVRLCSPSLSKAEGSEAKGL
jgi:hypothetical protein